LGTDDSSDNEDEDQFGGLINENISDNFLMTLSKIRAKNPEIYDSKI